MRTYITIDGGTTNTRLRLVRDGWVVDAVKLDVGARAGIENKDLLKARIRQAVQTLLQNHGLTAGDVERILASGMITSEFGLCNLPHITLPAGIRELHDNLHQTVLEDVSEIPFVFVRGVKAAGASFEDTDVMRGEETELMGIAQQNGGRCAYVLPGSHSKLIYTDESGRISGFFTTLTGEMIAALSQNTILKDAVDLSLAEPDEDYLLKGYDFCRAEGLNKALFKTRVLKNFFGCSKAETYGFFIGAVLCGEIGQILDCDAETVVLGGREQIKNAMAAILKQRSDKRVVTLDSETVEASTVRGIIRIYEYHA